MPTPIEPTGVLSKTRRPSPDILKCLAEIIDADYIKTPALQQRLQQGNATLLFSAGPIKQLQYTGKGTRGKTSQIQAGTFQTDFRGEELRKATIGGMTLTMQYFARWTCPSTSSKEYEKATKEWEESCKVMGQAWDERWLPALEKRIAQV